MRAWATWLLVTGFVALASTNAWAAPPDAAAKKRKEAQTLLADGDYEGALKAVDEALVLAPEQPSALQLRAKILLEVRDHEGSLAAYEAFLKVAPAGGNRRAAQKIIKTLAPVRTTFLEIKVASGPVDVFLDSKSLGVWCVAGPVCKKGLLPGDYKLILEREGFDTEKKMVVVVIGETAAVDTALVEKPSTLSITTAPPAATLVLDGKVIGASPETLEVRAGDHELEVRAEGHQTARQQVSVHQGKPVDVAVTLAEVVRVTTSVPDVVLTLDGQPVTLEAEALVLPLGEKRAHTLVAKANGFVDRTLEIPVERPVGYALEVALKRIQVKVTLTHAPAGAIVSVDGQVAGTMPLAQPLSLDPGEHTIELQAAGVSPYKTRASFDVDTTMDVDVIPPPVRWSWPFMYAAGVSTVGGLFLWSLAYGKRSELMEKAAGADGPALQSDGRKMAVLGDIGLGVAAAAGATAAYLWWGERKAPTRDRIETLVTPTGVVVSGTF
jgi:hypothetical protein